MEPTAGNRQSTIKKYNPENGGNWRAERRVAREKWTRGSERVMRVSQCLKMEDS
jgi:hypothetical protein